MFAKLKGWVRYAAERTRDATCTAIAYLFDTITEGEFATYLADSG